MKKFELSVKEKQYIKPLCYLRIHDSLLYLLVNTAKQWEPRVRTGNQYCRTCFPSHSGRASGSPTHQLTMFWKRNRDQDKSMPSEINVYSYVSCYVCKTYPRCVPLCNVLIKNPLSPSTTRCEHRLAKDGKKTPVRNYKTHQLKH